MPRTIQHRPGEIERAVVTLLSQCRQRRTARITQAQQLGRLVERLAHRIVERGSEQFVLAECAHRNQHRMPPRHQEREERELGRIVLEHRREEMALHVVYRDDRTVPGQPQARRHAAADHQCADEARPRGVGDRIGALDACLRQHLLHQRQQAPDVVARGYFRHDSAVNRVQVHLAVQRIGEQAPFRGIQRDPGLVAAGFDTENVHGGE